MDWQDTAKRLAAHPRWEWLRLVPGDVLAILRGGTIRSQIQVDLHNALVGELNRREKEKGEA